MKIINITPDASFMVSAHDILRIMGVHNSKVVSLQKIEWDIPGTFKNSEGGETILARLSNGSSILFVEMPDYYIPLAFVEKGIVLLSAGYTRESFIHKLNSVEFINIIKTIIS